MADPHEDLPPGRYCVTVWASKQEMCAEKRPDGSWHYCDGTGWSDPFLPEERILTAKPWPIPSNPQEQAA